MPWRRAKLRDANVFARCTPDGELSVDKGRVEIRYNADDTRAYRASPRNLTDIDTTALLPDDHCAPLEERKPEKPHFQVPVDANSLVFYADGACSGNPGPAGLGVVSPIEDGKFRELSEYIGTGTNNVAELTAILRAAEAVEDKKYPVRIYTDSLYSIGVLTRGWRPKVNGELIANVKKALAALADVRLIHVPGHAGVELNERADVLAREAVQSRTSTGWVTR